MRQGRTRSNKVGQGQTRSKDQAKKSDDPKAGAGRDFGAAALQPSSSRTVGHEPVDELTGPSLLAPTSTVCPSASSARRRMGIFFSRRHTICLCFLSLSLRHASVVAPPPPALRFSWICFFYFDGVVSPLNHLSCCWKKKTHKSQH